MGVDVAYYISGIVGDSKFDKDVINAAENLSYDTDGMKVSIQDDPSPSRYFVDDGSRGDGFCVIESLARAHKESYREQREDQIEKLVTLFPGRPIYAFSDMDIREEIVSLIKQEPDYRRIV